MEPMTPEPQRPFSIPTFAQVQSAFRNDPTMTTFPCLMHNARVGECVLLGATQVQNASLILCSDLPTTLRDVWNVINCLVCIQHQGDRIYTHKHRVKDHWQMEFPNLDLSSSPMPRSRYSLCSSPRQALRSTPLRSARAQTSSHRRNEEEPVTPIPERQQTDAEDVTDNDVDMDDEPFIATPDSTRTPSVAETEESDHYTSAEEDRTPSPSPNPPPRRTSSPFSPQRTFTPGSSSTWPLWRIRQDVRHLLIEPLPLPKAHGILYAIESLQHHKVKIGWTMRKNPNERFKELEKQHGAPLGNSWYLDGIPYVQLRRLEELVHADLAKYQCDFRVPFGRGSGARVHREWFDIDMHTASTTIDFWWAAMRHLRIKPGRELDERVRGRLNTQGAMFEVKQQNVDGRFGDYRDHEKTLGLWRELLRVPQRRAKTWMDRWRLVVFAAVAWFCCTEWMPSHAGSWGKSTMLLFAIAVSWL
ncbi:hypothetical protein M409DRAFT_27589 [Zasmidium cellare ATCC 36951]|uniref:Bacteriophage T5 Orf172 DNA-binding domain-containing protein n=1 Tax=Zasmidium cellare ATCC 36951 TaxID=1080233 RepID=A0A6A6C6N4_ZASCE|nr:uncharacterized protein M409DRAFT_27589 [Zasmidium cellare ATCC 36951]KAF2161860.1 hypothetical protein M409DRAFT_27589 [Zasmidium cellare ATCC 36951]